MSKASSKSSTKSSAKSPSEPASKYTINVEKCEIVTIECKGSCSPDCKGCASKGGQEGGARSITVYNYGNVYFCCKGCCSGVGQEGSKCVINCEEPSAEETLFKPWSSTKSESSVKAVSPAKSEKQLSKKQRQVSANESDASIKTTDSANTSVGSMSMLDSTPLEFLTSTPLSTRNAISKKDSEGSKSGSKNDETVLPSDTPTGTEKSTKLPVDSASQTADKPGQFDRAIAFANSTPAKIRLTATSQSENQAEMTKPSRGLPAMPALTTETSSPVRSLRIESERQVKEHSQVVLNDSTTTAKLLDRSVSGTPVLPLDPGPNNVADNQVEGVKQPEEMLNEAAKTQKSLDPYSLQQKSIKLLGSFDGKPITTNLTLNIKSKNKDAKLHMQEMWVDGIRVFSRSESQKK